MARFEDLQRTETNAHHKRIFEILASHENSAEETSDGYEAIALDSGELSLIRDEMYANVKDGLSDDGDVQTATQMKESLRINIKKEIEEANERFMTKGIEGKGIIQDGYFNPVSGIGTAIDPGMTTQSFIPVSLTPTEATSYYANGGVPARIIDKKAGCLLLNGLKFKCDEMSPEDLTTLELYAHKCGFTEAFREGVTQALIFGGSVVYPMLAGDNPLTTQKGIKELLENLPEKNFIKLSLIHI